MNFVLIGMRGSGKTTIAKILGRKLHKQFIEMDDLIVERAGMSIAEIVERHGWDYFRDLESEVCKEVSKENNAVISTGGGAVIRESNVDDLEKNGKLIFLQTSITTILKRIGHDKNRPSLTGKLSVKQDLQVSLRQRENIYLDVSDLIIETDTKTPEEIADIIINKLKTI